MSLKQHTWVSTQWAATAQAELTSALSAAGKPVQAARHLDDNALRIWLDLVRLGGYWKVGELRRQWFPSLSGDEVRDCLDRLHNCGMVRERRSMGAHGAYGVTTLCNAPPGYEHVLKGGTP